ncbi:hypothetical protein SNEBB_005672 [Seison nebaliae]|nr:hypothetical protein SNEBB_005672 [Seison nebaliae]
MVDLMSINAIAQERIDFAHKLNVLAADIDHGIYSMRVKTVVISGQKKRCHNCTTTTLNKKKLAKPKRSFKGSSKQIDRRLERKIRTVKKECYKYIEKCRGIERFEKYDTILLHIKRKLQLNEDLEMNLLIPLLKLIKKLE